MSPLCAPRVRHRRVAVGRKTLSCPAAGVLPRRTRRFLAACKPAAASRAHTAPRGVHPCRFRARNKTPAPEEIAGGEEVWLTPRQPQAGSKTTSAQRWRHAKAAVAQPPRGRRRAVQGRASRPGATVSAQRPCRGSARGLDHSEPAPPSTTFLTACRRSATVNRPRLPRAWATVPVPRGRSREDAPEPCSF
jgi:hypothetical protein